MLLNNRCYNVEIEIDQIQIRHTGKICIRIQPDLKTGFGYRLELFFLQKSTDQATRIRCHEYIPRKAAKKVILLMDRPLKKPYFAASPRQWKQILFETSETGAKVWSVSDNM